MTTRGTLTLLSLELFPRVSCRSLPCSFAFDTDAALLIGEVEDLKDSLGGGETVDNEAGVTTRGAKNDAYAQEKEVDKLDL